MDVKQKAVTGVKWRTVASVYNLVIQVVKYAVLTRLLDKSDFGLIAIAMMIISFTEIFSEVGLTVGIIHKQDITQKQYSSLYWFNVFASIMVFCALCLLTPFFATFYSEPLLNTIIPILGVHILLNGFGKMFQTIKTKQMEFAFISKVGMLVTTVSFIITALLAYLGLGIYSLVYGTIISVAINQLCFVIAGIGREKILLHFNYSEIRDFMKIGIYQLSAFILDFISNKLDVFLIGKFFGMEDLGVYNIAKDLVQKLYGVIKGLVSSVATSSFALIQNDKMKVKRALLYTIKVVSFASIPFYVMLFAFADTIVSILYSSEFGYVAVFVRILAFIGIENSISGMASGLVVAYGRTDIGLKWTVLRVVMSASAICIASIWTIEAVAYGQLIIAIASLYLYWLIAVKPLCPVSFMEYVRDSSRSFVASLIFAVPFIVCMYFFNIEIYIQIAFVIFYWLLYSLYCYMIEKEFTVTLFKSLIKKKV